MRQGGTQAALALGALGVVFGDIGTSPLYTVQTVFNPTEPHDALTLQVALMLGRLEDAGTLL